jgi:hypothetical protein
VLTKRAVLAVALSLTSLFHAISSVESCHRDLNSEGHIGRYQISYAYWKDSNTPGQWSDVSDAKYAELVMLNYFRRFAALALRREDYQILARIHNGGPDGAEEPETKKYWSLVKEYLDDPGKPCN